MILFLPGVIRTLLQVSDRRKEVLSKYQLGRTNKNSSKQKAMMNLLNTINHESYREQYYKYIKEVAVIYLDADRFQEETNQIADLILDYVEKDPTKFFTTEEFLEGVSGENSLVKFAELRADSIFAQLSGDLVVESNVNGGAFGRGGNFGSAFEGGVDGGRGEGNMPRGQGGQPPQMMENADMPDREAFQGNWPQQGANFFFAKIIFNIK